MTCVAFRMRVAAVKDKVRECVIERSQWPCADVVAARTVAAKCAVVRINFCVTVIAARRRRAVQGVDVTGLAGLGRVRAQQHERRLVVIEARLLPILYAMTTSAVFAETAAMRVLHAVTAGALEWGFYLVQFTRVAGFALNRFMRAAQGEPCLRVIEARLLPCAGVVAFRAGGAIAPLMGVVSVMTGNARHRRCFEVQRVHMATLARGGLVLASQHKTGGRVIESMTWSPSSWGMAVLACCAQRAVVLVILAVTAAAGIREPFESTGCAMAIATFGLCMLTKQRKAGARMIELGVLPLRVPMALLAIGAKAAAMHIGFRVA